MSLGLGGAERGFTGAAQSEEDGGIAGGSHIGAAVHAEHIGT